MAIIRVGSAGSMCAAVVLAAAVVSGCGILSVGIDGPRLRPRVDVEIAVPQPEVVVEPAPSPVVESTPPQQTPPV